MRYLLKEWESVNKEFEVRKKLYKKHVDAGEEGVEAEAKRLELKVERLENAARIADSKVTTAELQLEKLRGSAVEAWEKVVQAKEDVAQDHGADEKELKQVRNCALYN